MASLRARAELKDTPSLLLHTQDRIEVPCGSTQTTAKHSQTIRAQHRTVMWGQEGPTLVPARVCLATG